MTNSALLHGEEMYSNTNYFKHNFKDFQNCMFSCCQRGFYNSQLKVIISFVTVTRVTCPILYNLQGTEIIWSHNNRKEIQDKISWFNCRSNFVRTSIINRQYYSITRFLLWDFALFDKKHLSEQYITVFLVQAINL